MPEQGLICGFEHPKRQERRGEAPRYHDPKTLPLPQQHRLAAILLALQRARTPLTASQVAGKALLHNCDGLTEEDLWILFNDGKVIHVGNRWAIRARIQE